MRIGIVSDTHNNLENTLWAVDVLRSFQVERVIHCGDLTTPSIIEAFAGLPTVFVFGNMDHTHSSLMAAATAHMGEGTIGYSYTSVWAGKKIAVYHGDIPNRLDDLIESQRYDYVFHGHTHRRRDEQIDSTRVINPGALGGRRPQTRSVCILELATGEATFIELEA